MSDSAELQELAGNILSLPDIYLSLDPERLGYIMDHFVIVTRYGHA